MSANLGVFSSNSHRIVILPAPACRGRGCNFIDFSREVIDLNEFVIPTGAYPDFLPRSAGHGRVCGFP